MGLWAFLENGFAYEIADGGCSWTIWAGSPSLGLVDGEDLCEGGGEDDGKEREEHADEWSAHVFRCPVRGGELFRGGLGPQRFRFGLERRPDACTV